MSQVGNMLRLARQRLGLTQKSASSQLGVAQPILSRFENGVADPDDGFMHKASQVYRVPREFFDLSDPVYGPPVSVHPMPRAKSDVTARDLDMVTAELNIRVMQLRRFLQSVDFEPTADLPSLNVEEWGSPSRVASMLRSHWGIPSGPIRSVTALVERAGVVVGTSDFGGASISGMTFKVPGQPPLVLLNALHPADRMRYTLAHELGHIIMHKFPTPSMEDEAQQFASHFLMPDQDICASFMGRRITLELLASLKPEWKVSMQSLLMKSKSLNVVLPNQYRYLWQQISARGWKLREPPELDFPHEQPTVMKSILNAHVRNFGYSLADLSGFVPIYENEFVKMYPSFGDDPPRPRLRIVA